MSNTFSRRVLSMLLVIVMLMSTMTVLVSASAADIPDSMTFISSMVTPLAPGVDETKYTVLDKNGDQVVYYAITADIASTDTVQVKANYHDNDNTGVWGKATVVEQANAATAKRGYNVVATTNASYYNVSTGQPTGGFVMEGVNINGDGAGNSYPFFAVMKDGTAMIGQKGTFSQYSADIQEAVGGWQMLVWDGKLVATNDTSKYPRSTVGIKANGDVVLMLADGNQKPYSAGLTYVEQGQVMMELGCVAAVELDGGGSATYAAKPEGTDEVVVRNSCCDGTVRSVSNTLMVISTAVADGTFDHANLSVDYAYYAPNSDVAINAIGADLAGYPAEIPENATWALSDDSFGTVADGVFTSNGKTGTVTVNMLVDGVIVGSVDVSVEHPTEIAFQAERKMVPYGRPSDFTVKAVRNGADMYASADAFDFACTAGTMDGFLFTAPDDGPKEATVTATYKYADIASATIEVEFGRGSDILFDFEDGIDEWGTYFDLKEAEANGEYTNGVTTIYESDGATSGNLVEYGIHEDVFLADRTNGKVYRGDYSLGYTLDYRYSTAHANWQYAYLYYWGEPIVLKDIDNDIAGTRLGMWMYIPEEAVGSCARFAYTYKDNTTGNINTAYLYLTYQYVEKGFSKLTSDKIPEAGWAYVYVDMKQISDIYVSTSYYKDANGNMTRAADSNYAPAFIQFIVSSSATGAEKCTFYIDDITLDYSDAVDDRDMPIISNPLVLEDQDSFAIDGRTLNYNTITVTADAKEDTSRGTNYTGLDEATAQVYVDGHKVDTKFAAGKISATGITLPNGTHDITFEVADKQGNYTKLTKQIVIAGENEAPVVALNGAATALKADGMIYTGGQYNMTLDTDRVESVNKVNFKVWLNSASEWALEHMTVLPGFEVEYTLDEKACTADITVTRVDSNAVGAATLLTIPVYAWSWNEELGHNTASYQWNNQGCAPQTAVSYKVKYGEVEYDSDYGVHVAGFSNKRVDAKTELNSSIANLKKTIGEWHYHTEAAIDDVAATCTTDGYTGRTVCTVCASVLNWGTDVPATGHSYAVVDNKIACSCGAFVETTGFYPFNGELYYILLGTLQTGWIVDSNTMEYYFFDRDTYTAVDGVQTIDGFTYTFEDKILVEGHFFKTDEGIRYRWAGKWQPFGWFTVRDKSYCVLRTGYLATGDHIFSVSAEPIRGYSFDENGVLIGYLSDGLHVYETGTYYTIDGYPVNGLVLAEDGYYYYFSSSKNYKAVTGSYYVTEENSNGLGYVGMQEFDENGRMIVHVPKNGFYTEDGVIRYYVDDKMQSDLGLIEIDGNYYYINSSAVVVTGKYFVSRHNDMGYTGWQYFYEDGRMHIPGPTEVTVDKMTITVTNLQGIKDIFVAKGEYSVYRDVANNKIYHVTGTSSKLDNYKWEYMTTSEGKYTVLVRYTDGSEALYTVVECNNAGRGKLTFNGRTFTVSGLEDLKVFRFVKGEYTTSAQIKRAPGVYNLTGTSTKIKNDSFTYKLGSAGTYSFVVQFKDGTFMYYMETIE